MKSLYFQIKACSNVPITESWRADLIAMLGGKPRRLSTWCELGLLGALSCVKTAQPSGLPSEVPIRVYTESGTISATRRALEQNKEHTPMPFTFMQTQPSQLFNALGGALAWNGDGATLSSQNLQQYETFALQEVQQSVLLAWVEEEPHPISSWIWLEKTALDSGKIWEKIGSIFQTTKTALWLKIDVDGQIYQGY